MKLDLIPAAPLDAAAAARASVRKKLAIFCDGTWNDLRAPCPTNVVLLAKAVDSESASGRPQVVYYDDGVGVPSHVSAVGDELVKLWGGAFGRGLDRKIEAAYRFLVLNYVPGDDIYVFGFSRGAYTARSLCGLVRKCGILRRSALERIPEAMKLYRDARHPREPEVADFRVRHAYPDLATGDEDYLRLGTPVRPFDAQTHPMEAGAREEIYQYRPRSAYSMMFLGLWDTVGSLGVLDRVPWSKYLNREYRFHDTNVSTLIASVRHAVAIDEDRRAFGVTPVDNISDLNLQWASRTGWNVSDDAGPHFVPYAHRPYQQRWFPGDHGAVGGGNPEPGLSSAALLWVAEGAQAAGLAFDQSALLRARGLVNPAADWRIRRDGSRPKKGSKDLLGQLGGYRPRRGPQRAEEVGSTARIRWCAMADDYRPGNLSVLRLETCPPPTEPPAPEGFPAA